MLDNRRGGTLEMRLRESAAVLAGHGVRPDTLHENGHLVSEELIRALQEVTPVPESDSGHYVLKGILAEFVEDPGPTPESWDTADPGQTRELDLALALIGNVAGAPFGWVSQQDGRLVHDIVPSKGFEELQVGASSTVKLEWHTEDSYHPDRPELLMLACVRNLDSIGTDLASIRRAELSAEDLELLTTTPVLIYPDDSYADGWSEEGNAPKMMTVWETADGLCMRFDPPYTKLPADRPEFRAAWERLGESLERCATTVMTEPGDVLIVNNDVAAHARRPFTARYDGTDRWLKRVLARGPSVRLESERDEPGYSQRQVGPFPSLRLPR